MKGWQIDAGSYRAGSEYKIAVFSDPHIEIEGDNSLLVSCLDEAVKQRCRLMFNGDISDWIYYLDKRYVPSRAQKRKVKDGPEDDPELDAEIDNAVDYLVAFLRPYAEHIDFIAYGNHETVGIKKYLTNPVRRACRELGVKSGAFRQLVRYRWMRDGITGSKTPSRSLTVYFHHGSKSVAVMNKGILALREMYLGADADVYVVGHGHRALVDAGDVHWYMDLHGNIRRHVRKGMQVPGFGKDYTPSGRDFPDKFYRGTPRGYGVITVTFHRRKKRDCMEYDLNVIVRDGDVEED